MRAKIYEYSTFAQSPPPAKKNSLVSLFAFTCGYVCASKVSENHTVNTNYKHRHACPVLATRKIFPKIFQHYLKICQSFRDIFEHLKATDCAHPRCLCNLLLLISNCTALKIMHVIDNWLQLLHIPSGISFRIYFKSSARFLSIVFIYTDNLTYIGTISSKLASQTII